MGRLLKVTTPTDTIEYKHNALGNRVAKILNGEVVEKYLWKDKTTLLATYDKDDNLKQRFEYSLGHVPVAFEENGNRYYILTNQIGSPRFITNESGSIVKQIDYDSFGNVISDSNPGIEIPFGFAGGLKDEHTGLIRFGYRDYDPNVGRWTARDPIGFAGGDTNLYGYVASSPVQFIDPRGLARCQYSISSHTIVCISDSGQIREVGPNNVFSGQGGDRNNPDSTGNKSSGPVPTGEYNMVRSDKYGGSYWLQESWTDRQLCKLGVGRCEFFMHEGTVSEGCITAYKHDPEVKNQWERLMNMLDSESKNTMVVVP